MGECELCDGDPHLSYTCNECGGTYCTTHRLPESHNCRALRSKSDDAWFKDELTVRSDNDTTSNDTDSSSNSRDRPPDPSKSRDQPPGATKSDNDDSPEPLSDDRLDEIRTGTADESSSDDTPDTLSETCIECGRVTMHECDHCGLTFCKEHKMPNAHGCTAPRDSAADTDDSQGLTGAVLSILFLPIGLLIMALSFLRSHWKLSLLLIAVGAAGGLAGTGNLQPAVDDVQGAWANTTNNNDSGVTGGDDSGGLFNDDLNESRVEVLVHEGINEVRQNRSRSQLRHDPELREIASDYSERMATEGFYSHTDPQGNDFGDRYAAAGYSCRVDVGGNRYTTGGENILYTYANTDVRTDSGTVHYDSEEELAHGIVQAWMNSEGHRENILQSYWQNEGIGVYAIDNPDGPGLKVYATQNFC